MTDFDPTAATDALGPVPAVPLPAPAKGAEQAPARRVVAPGTDQAAVLPDVGMIVSIEPTQVRRPWRSTARTVFQAFLGLCVLAPVLVQAADVDVDQLPWLLGVLAVAAAVTRVMALPGVEQWLQRFLPFLSAAPAAGGEHRRNDAGATTFQTVGATALILALVATLLLVLPLTR